MTVTPVSPVEWPPWTERILVPFLAGNTPWLQKYYFKWSLNNLKMTPTFCLEWTRTRFQPVQVSFTSKCPIFKDWVRKLGSFTDYVYSVFLQPNWERENQFSSEVYFLCFMRSLWVINETFPSRFPSWAATLQICIPLSPHRPDPWPCNKLVKTCPNLFAVILFLFQTLPKDSRVLAFICIS